MMNKIEENLTDQVDTSLHYINEIMSDYVENCANFEIDLSDEEILMADELDEEELNRLADEHAFQYAQKTFNLAFWEGIFSSQIKDFIQEFNFRKEKLLNPAPVKKIQRLSPEEQFFNSLSPYQKELYTKVNPKGLI